VAILTGTGGIGAELADLATRQGLELPSFSPVLQQRLRELLPHYAGVGNPVDCTPIWWEYARLYPAILELLAKSGEVDLAMVSVSDVAATLPELASSLAGWLSKRPPLPTVFYWGARDRDRDNMQIIQQAGGPCYRSTSETARAAAALAPK
jgi:acetyltransferase